MTYIRFTFVLTFIMLAAALIISLQGRSLSDATSPRFSNESERWGVLDFQPTFSISVSDVNDDGRDDLLIGNQEFVPTLLINRGDRFEKAAADVMGISAKAERYGYSLVDIDNDGDRDILVAAAHNNHGATNQLLRNMLVETGELRFGDVTGNSGIAAPGLASQQFYPLPSADGSLIDTYLTARHKPTLAKRNQYLVNSGGMSFTYSPMPQLTEALHSTGKDLFFDFDRDGYLDFLKVEGGPISIYRNSGDAFSVLPNPEIGNAEGAISAAVGDINNDGYPDLYLGAVSGPSGGDNLSWADNAIHYSVKSHQPGDTDEFTFKTPSRRFRVDLIQHLPSEGRTVATGEGIFFGEGMSQPKYRDAPIGRHIARGKPAEFAEPGIYIWYQDSDDTWYVKVNHGEINRSKFKGRILAEDIQAVERRDFEPGIRRQARDYIFINEEGRSWRELRMPELEHSGWTQFVTAADLNNDGHIDFAGIRTNDEALPNGDPFLMINLGGGRFRLEETIADTADDIYRADVIVHGFFNDDGLPDLFYTNGHGPRPSRLGPYQLWLNQTKTNNQFLLVDLVGTTANRDAIGAQVELYNASDELIGYREIGPGYGRGQDSHTLHFGLGQARGEFRLAIRWPGSTSIQNVSVNPNQRLTIRQQGK